MAMKATLLNKWCENLESGKFTQCQGRLHKKNDGFCCLGVLACTLGWDRKKLINKGTIIRHSVGTSNVGLSLDPAEVGLTYREQNILTGMNDGLHQPKHTFRQIAIWLRINIKTTPD